MDSPFNYKISFLQYVLIIKTQYIRVGKNNLNSEKHEI